MTTSPVSRRRLLGWGFGSAFLAACGGRAAHRPDAALSPTPQIPDDDEPAPQVCRPTDENIEGPFFKAGAPHRAVLAGADTPGQRLELGGVVRGADCQPLAGAVLELWHADAAGAYDLRGWHLRGRLTTDARGRWQASTIVPGRYLNGPRYRPRHVHVKLHAPGHVSLTTQLYFAGDPYNDGDAFFLPSLLLAAREDQGRVLGRFDFALAPA